MTADERRKTNETMNTKTTVIYHSADFDGIFCREIARKFLPADTEFIGWNFGDGPLAIPEGKIYVLDLPLDEPFGFKMPRIQPEDGWLNRVIWIDHHKSSIESHPTDIPGYRIDGVAACRLAWQWFRFQCGGGELLPTKNDYGVLLPGGERTPYQVSEPLAVRLAGEYDIWDKRDPHADTLQFALRSMPEDELPWKFLLSAQNGHMFTDLIDKGRLIESYVRRMDEQIAKSCTFDLAWEGLNFLAINAVRCNSKTFEAAVQPKHDALLGFHTDGAKWTVSMYHAPHRKDLDLSAIAVKHGGGGHKGACGFRCETLPFLKS